MSEAIEIIARSRLPLVDEKALQAAISERFTQAGLPFQREVPVMGGIIDFLVEGVGIEVKINGQAKSIYRQLVRYAEDSRIDELILASNRAMALPTRIGGKRCRIIHLGRAWL